MTRVPTGHLLRNQLGGINQHPGRTFRAPIDDVWASLTESARLERWIGRWEVRAGPDRTVSFRMTTEGDVPPEDVLIRECEAPRRLTVESQQSTEIWRVSLSLTEADGVTSLDFAMVLPDGHDPSDPGPGWEFYLDRLVAGRATLPMPEWDEFYPAQKPCYAEAMASVV